MATTPEAQRTTPAISLATLQAVLARGQAAHSDLAARLDKAAHIVATRAIEPSGDDGRSYWVPSETQPGQLYLVIIAPRGPWPCTCRDYERRQTWCKHSLALALRRRCEEIERQQAESTPAYVNITPAGAAYLDGYDDGKAGRPHQLHTVPAVRAAYGKGYADGAAAAPTAGVPA
jgi:hypothetical protein